jgi:hypothetical protein
MVPSTAGDHVNVVIFTEQLRKGSKLETVNADGFQC